MPADLFLRGIDFRDHLVKAFAQIFDFIMGGADLDGLEFPFPDRRNALLPWTAAGFVLMVISGALLFYAIPVRTFQNIFFRIKVALLILSGLNVWIFHSGIYRRMTEWDLDPVPPRRARVAAGLSLALWAGIVVAGRMIAYNWFD